MLDLQELTHLALSYTTLGFTYSEVEQIIFTNEDTGSDVDPDWLYADLDPKNLINADPIPGQ